MHSLNVFRYGPSAAGYFQRQRSYVAEGGERPLRVACYTSENPLDPRNWAALDSHEVIVASGQTLLNALAAGTDRLAAVRFLVRAHSCRVLMYNPLAFLVKVDLETNNLSLKGRRLRAVRSVLRCYLPFSHILVIQSNQDYWTE